VATWAVWAKEPHEGIAARDQECHDNGGSARNTISQQKLCQHEAGQPDGLCCASTRRHDSGGRPCIANLDASIDYGESFVHISARKTDTDEGWAGRLIAGGATRNQSPISICAARERCE
jgi:hypothetical protein